MTFLSKLKRVSKLRLSSPRSSEVLVWDTVNSDELVTVFRNHAPVVLSIRGEEVFFLPALIALFRRTASESFTVRYSREVIRRIRPKVVITRTDNNADFYRIKRGLQNNPPVFAVVQNARRSLKGDLSQTPPEPGMEVDLAFLFNRNLEIVFKPYAGKNCQMVSFGSLKLSLFADQLSERRPVPFSGQYICYVSDYRDPELNQRFPWDVDRDGKAITYKQLFEVEHKLLAELKLFSEQSGLGILVARSRPEDSAEKRFFKKSLGDSMIAIVDKTRWSSYELMAGAELVVTIDSTLGYESLAFGKKTLMCCARVEGYNFPEKRFGWPLEFDFFGPFWMNRWSAEHIQRSLRELSLQRESIFFETHADIIKEVMEPVMSSAVIETLCFERVNLD